MVDGLEQIKRRNADAAKAGAELRLRRRQMSRFPFCPDHRDKVQGKPCRECEVELLHHLLLAAKHLLKAATGPVGGPDDWNETRERWMKHADRMLP